VNQIKQKLFNYRSAGKGPHQVTQRKEELKIV
jgi:hypothetical protein